LFESKQIGVECLKPPAGSVNQTPWQPLHDAAHGLGRFPQAHGLRSLFPSWYQKTMLKALKNDSGAQKRRLAGVVPPPSAPCSTTP
jgi:hypothetical protein